MIIVEGPDNSGKTTLVASLVKDLKLKVLDSDIKGPPLDAQDNYFRTKSLILKALKHPRSNTITDRLSLIGESIYGPICRGKDLWVPMFEKKMKMYTVLKIIDPFFIYCRPPKNIVLNMGSHQLKDYDTPEHITQVEKNKALILKAYDNYFAFFRAYNFFQYDYTQPEHYETLIQRLKEYLKRW